MKKLGRFIIVPLLVFFSLEVYSAKRVFSIELEPTSVLTITANADGGNGVFDTVLSKQIEIENDMSGVTLLEFDAAVRNLDPSGNYNPDYALNACFRMMIDGVEVDKYFYIVQEKKWEVAHVFMKSLQNFNAGIHLVEIQAGRCWDNVPPFQFRKTGILKIMSGF